MQNTDSGVLIEATGIDKFVEKFTTDISTKSPPAAHIEHIKITSLTIPAAAPSTFTIKDSSVTGKHAAFIPPDMDICEQCLNELFDPNNRRYLYPFINCTNCGPRYTLIHDLPYDRESTSMKCFTLCALCSEEYHDPNSRRFHAQPNACEHCGPELELFDALGTKYHTENPIGQVNDLLNQGFIVAIKGIGGFHLAVNASNTDAIDRLRRKKGRPDKPLAIMSDCLATIETFSEVSSSEKKALQSQQKPIVLLKKNHTYPLPANIAPANNYIGTMLPYSPLHHLLFHKAPYNSLVMTSGNLSDEPIAIDNDQAITSLSTIADYFLTHNRDILISNDDSVLYMNNDHPVFIRRSRSYAPAPIHTHFDIGKTLAVGGALKNSLCVTKGHQCFMSQHIGDLDHYETTQHFESIAHHLQHTLSAEPDLVVHDLHPDYYSTRYAKSLALPSIAVQHHHAHAVSCMAENNLEGPVIAIILDGTGLGPDDTIWGGEILTATHSNFERCAHFDPVHLPGGDTAVREPWRMALSYLLHTFDGDLQTVDLDFLENYKDKIDIIMQMISKRINSPLTSSCGRLFDAVSSLIGLRQLTSFEGQAAINLEMIAAQSFHPSYSYAIKKRPNNNCLILSFKNTIIDILNDLNHNISRSVISKRFHETVAKAVSEASQSIRETNGINQIVLSGGSFQNRILLNRVRQILIEYKFFVYSHNRVPTNDGGLCLGQALAGRSISRL